MAYLNTFIFTENLDLINLTLTKNNFLAQNVLYLFCKLVSVGNNELFSLGLVILVINDLVVVRLL